MQTVQPRMTNLFEQLGLDSSAEAIESFIKNNQLESNVMLVDAPFWNAGQRQFLEEKLRSDDNWVTIVDQLNESLHEDANKAVK